MNNIQVGIEIALQDHASARANEVFDRMAKGAQEVAQKSGGAFEAMSKKINDSNEALAKRVRASHSAMIDARETLGVRSETRIRREIAQTEAAYNRLARSGKLSADEQARAYDAMRQKITQLTNEMGKMTAEQQKQANLARQQEDLEKRRARGAAIMRGGVAAGVGVVAAGATMIAPAKAAMTYDERIGLLANTAFAERDVAGRRIGEESLREAIKKAIAKGITIDSATAALEKLIADDQVGGVQSALNLLPYIAKISTGSGSQADAVAAMMGSFIGSGYAKNADGTANLDQAKRLIGIASAGATAGAFEKEDMARNLPALLPLARTAGLTGEKGFIKLITLLQQARTTAGTSDEAANNVRNLLSKLQSNDTAADFKKAGRGDLAKFLMDQQSKGIDPLTAWQNTIDEEVKKNPNLKPAIDRLKKAKNVEDENAAIEALKGMAQGQGIGKYFQDMQAKGAVFGMFNRDVEKNVQQAIGQLSGTVIDTDYQSIADRAGVKTRVAGQQIELAKMSSMDSLTPTIGKVAEAMGSLAEKFPNLTGATFLATTALTALAGAAGLSALMMGGKIPGSGKIAGAMGGIAEKVGALGRGALAAGGGLISGIGGTLTTMGTTAVGAAGAGAIAGTVGAGAAIGTGIGLGINWLYEKAFTDSIGTSLQRLLGGKEYDPNAITAKNAPKMEGKITVSVEDHRVSVRQSSLTSENMNAQMETGNIFSTIM